MGMEVLYVDIAPSARLNSTVVCIDKQSFVDLTQMQKDDLESNIIPQYGTLEHNYYALDGNFGMLPAITTGITFGYWSNQVSGADGVFGMPIVMEVTFNNQYTSQGISLEFNKYQNNYCNHLNIKWYNGATLLANQDFNPTGYEYYCSKAVTLYNKVVFTFYSTNFAYRRLKIANMVYGTIRKFLEDELQDVNLLHEISLASEELTINTLDFKINKKSDIEFMFQKMQPLILSFDGSLLGQFYVDTSKRTSETKYELSLIDDVGVLQQADFNGGIYSGVLASTILSSIFTTANVNYSVEAGLGAKLLTGYIPICTCREALQQVVFAIGGIADTSRNNKVDIYSLPSAITSNIPESRIFYGGAIETINIISRVELTSHSYLTNAVSSELFNGTLAIGNFEIRFTEPRHTLSITGGTITSSGANFAKINVAVSGVVVLSGMGYNHSTQIITVSNPNVSANEKATVVSITGATLISQNNVAEVCQLVYSKYIKRELLTSEIIIDGESVGDKITIVTPFGTKTGNIISMDANIWNSFIAKVVVQ
jgi:hypothetical protein